METRISTPKRYISGILVCDNIKYCITQNSCHDWWVTCCCP